MKLYLNRLCWEKHCLLFRESISWQRIKAGRKSKRRTRCPARLLFLCLWSNTIKAEKHVFLTPWDTCSHKNSSACIKCHSENMRRAPVHNGECWGEKVISWRSLLSAFGNAAEHPKILSLALRTRQDFLILEDDRWHVRQLLKYPTSTNRDLR